MFDTSRKLFLIFMVWAVALAGTAQANQITIINAALNGGSYVWDVCRADLNNNFDDQYATELIVDANVVQVGELVTLSGVPAHSEDFGTFTGVTIPDGSTDKEALQALETAVEAGGGVLTWGSITGTLSDQTDLQSALDGKAPSLGVDDNYVTDAQLVVVGNTSGTNTGDQVISDETITTTDNTTNDVSASKHGFAPKGDGSATSFLNGQGNYATPAGGGNVSTSGTPIANDFARFVNGTDVEGRSYTETKTDLSLGNVDNTSDANKPVSTATQTALDGKADSLGVDDNYVTDAELVVLQNTSNTNTGDMSDADVKASYENNADTNAFTDAYEAIIGFITVTQDVNLDTMESDIATNNAKVTEQDTGTNTGDQVISDETITTTDNTTNDVSSSKHGFAPKGDGSATSFLNGQGAYATPAGGGNVSTSGTPVTTDFARFVNGTDIEGLSSAEVQAVLDAEDQTPTGAIDQTGASSVAMGPSNWTAAAGVLTDGAFRYITKPTELAGNVFGTGNGTSQELFFQYITLPTTDGQFFIYNATSKLYVPFGMSGDATMTELGVVTVTNGTLGLAKDTGWTITDTGTAVAVADGLQGFTVPPSWVGMNITSVIAVVDTAGVTGTTDFQLRRVRAGSAVDVLSTVATIDTTELTTETAATPYVINTANDDLALGDKLFPDIDAISTTPPEGVSFTIEARFP